MSDNRSFHISPDEPARDARLGALLRDAVGDPPMSEVSWPKLAQRIATAVHAHQGAPWWSYVERWQRRALPLALAAGILGALAFWGTTSARPADASTIDLVSAVASGTSPADAASTFAHSVTGAMDVNGAVQE
ncbi:MAG: hypothetical protein M3Z10_10120 [Gemmatimonadota bacterium]|nr:hypothetical protein [Gemmatimonadota bacterium]